MYVCVYIYMYIYMLLDAREGLSWISKSIEKEYGQEIWV